MCVHVSVCVGSMSIHIELQTHTHYIYTTVCVYVYNIDIHTVHMNEIALLYLRNGTSPAVRFRS